MLNYRRLGAWRTGQGSLIACMIMTVVPAVTVLADEENTHRIEMAGGRLVLVAPEKWERKQPKFGIIQYEFAVPAADDDSRDGRVTMMAARGGVEANIDRWYGQFEQPDGSNTREKANREAFEVAGQKVHLIDLSGTYLDRPRPTAPAVERENYRMLAAIVESRESGLLFIKFYGPRQTVTDHEEPFVRMLTQLKAE